MGRVWVETNFRPSSPSQLRPKSSAKDILTHGRILSCRMSLVVNAKVARAHAWQSIMAWPMGAVHHGMADRDCVAYQYHPAENGKGKTEDRRSGAITPPSRPVLNPHLPTHLPFEHTLLHSVSSPSILEHFQHSPFQIQLRY